MVVPAFIRALGGVGAVTSSFLGSRQNMCHFRRWVHRSKFKLREIFIQNIRLDVYVVQRNQLIDL